MKEELVILDNGHGCRTPGKRSPDGRIHEWEWTRRVTRAVASRLNDNGMESVLLVPEDDDIPLSERCRRARALACGRKSILVSVHINAAGDGSAWHDARGFSVFVAPKASSESLRLVSLLTELAVERGLTGNRCIPSCGFWRGNFAIVRDTPMPAVLTENLFMDNLDDVSFLSSSSGFEAVVQLHVDAILKYFNCSGEHLSIK